MPIVYHSAFPETYFWGPIRHAQVLWYSSDDPGGSGKAATWVESPYNYVSSEISHYFSCLL